MSVVDILPTSTRDYEEEWPTFATALDGLVELEFWGWSCERPQSAEYRDQRGEVVDVHRLRDGRLVADLRED